MKLEDIKSLKIELTREQIPYTERDPGERLLDPDNVQGTSVLRTRIIFMDSPQMLTYNQHLSNAHNAGTGRDGLLQYIEVALIAVDRKLEEMEDGR